MGSPAGQSLAHWPVAGWRGTLCCKYKDIDVDRRVFAWERGITIVLLSARADKQIAVFELFCMVLWPNEF